MLEMCKIQTKKYIVNYFIILLGFGLRYCNQIVIRILRSLKYIYILPNDMLDIFSCTNWCSLCKHFLQALGFLDVWKYNTVSNSKLFLMLVKQKNKCTVYTKVVNKN